MTGEPPEHLRRTRFKQPSQRHLGTVKQYRVAIGADPAPETRSGHKRIGHVQQLEAGHLVGTELLGHSKRGHVKLDSAIVVQARVAVVAESMEDIEPQPADGQPIQSENAPRRQIRRNRQLTEPRGLRRCEACRVNHKLILAGTLEQPHRAPGVRKALRRAPVV
ncbi:MAG: hypothetical protein ABSG64_13955 [Solirubrobacteraceae bacterium]